MLAPEYLMRFILVKKRLLIIDDCIEVAEAAKRALKKHFYEVTITHCLEEADRILHGRCTSHVLCELHLDRGDENRLSGLVYAAKWRRSFSMLERIVFFTGANIDDITVPAYIDDIVPKTEGLEAIANALLNKQIA